MAIRETPVTADPPHVQPPVLPSLGSGEWGLLLVPVLLSLAMIVFMGFTGT